MADIAFQSEVVHTLENAIKTGNLPHLLFYGPPGTGKTSTILALAREIFGPEMMRQRVLELNASDERGIAVVRDKVKTFAQTAVSTHTVKGYTCPPFKIIVLDEADSLTKDAQSALRRTMEAYSKVTRVCFICNYVSRIIEPLASRCAKFRFKPLDSESMSKRLTHVAEAESVALPAEVADTLVSVSGGDLRKAITLMQSASELYAGDLTPEAVVEVAGVLPTNVIDKLWAAMRGIPFDPVRDAVSNLMLDGYSAQALLERLLDDVVTAADVDDDSKARMCQTIAEAEMALVDGGDEELQITNVAATMQRVLTNRPIAPLDLGALS